jgi:hypothetical protein
VFISVHQILSVFRRCCSHAEKKRRNTDELHDGHRWTQMKVNGNCIY